MRIAVYGGSFNPPHLAHQLVVTTALAAADPPVDELWLVPTFEHAFGKKLAPYANRVAMCEAAAAAFGGRVRVSRIEEALGGSSYTLRTLEALEAERPDDELVLVIGADLLAERPRWHRWEVLAEKARFLVVGREGHEGGPIGPRDQLVPIVLPGLSSTEVRRRLAAGEGTAGLLDARVARHAAARDLYRG